MNKNADSTGFTDLAVAHALIRELYGICGVFVFFSPIDRQRAARFIGEVFFHTRY
jgi:hypothetical protein